MTAAWSTPSRWLTTRPPAQVSSTTGSGAAGTRASGAGVDAQRMTARRRRDTPGDGWVRRAGHVDTVSTWHAYVPARTAASSAHGRLGRVPSVDPPVSPETPDLSAALVALQKRAIGVLAALPAGRARAGRAVPRRRARARARRRSGARRVPRPRLSADLDFTTSATPDETEAILARWGDAHWDIGREFGTIGARRFAGRRRRRRDDVVVEVTTYRTDAYDPTSRKPEVVFGDSLEGDLSRRDFTVNSMAVRLPELTFVDPFDGLTDLAAGVLRTPVDPRQSFDDDPLRMMRAARFAAQLGFGVDPAARAAIVDMADRIAIVSAERVRDELSQAAGRRRSRALGLEVLVDTGLADHVLPELPALRLEIDEHHRHKDVYEHSLMVLEQGDRPGDRPGRRGARPGPGAAPGGAAARHRQAADHAGSRRAAA